MDKLIIKGARQHNLKNIQLELPKDKLIVFTGLSGSGKSSLAFDTIYAEGQRRYVESLSSYARQFLGVMDKPDVDSIEGLSPAISIDQKSTSHNPRSTVGTVTEIYDYMRLLFARTGHPHCPNCGREISKLTHQQIVELILKFAKQSLESTKNKLFRFLILAPLVRDRKGEFTGLFDNLRAKGYRTIRIDGHFFDLDEDILLLKNNKHTIDLVIDKATVDLKSVKFLLQNTGDGKGIPDVALRSRISDAVTQALAQSEGLVILSEILDSGFTIPDKPKKTNDHVYSEKFSCPVCNISLSEIEPRTFSFNSPHGACPKCSGLGSVLTVDPSLVLSPELSILEGGILPFAKMFLHDTWYSRVVLTVSREHGMDPRKAIKTYSKEQIDVLLYGTGDVEHEVEGENRFGEHTTIWESYKGIVSELKRRFTESQSDYARDEIEKYMREEICTECNGRRLKKESLTITIDGYSIADITELSIADSYHWIKDLPNHGLSMTEEAIAKPILKEILARLGFLNAVGLEYLTLNRSATTLAGGEAQRIRLASQIGSGLSGVLYVLDEPSIGLHQRDNQRLIETLKKLRELGNTVIVVEHDREMMEQSDYLVDFGPGAGEHGGAIIAKGTYQEILKDKKSITAKYLRDDKRITTEHHTLSAIVPFQQLVLKGVHHNNLKNIDIAFPLGKLICITGVSGSGKSSLIVETLYPALFQKFNPLTKMRPGTFQAMEGDTLIDKVILIDQSPIGRTPRSNPATYTGLFSFIREIFAMLPESRIRGYKAGRFSFNVKGGRCEVCEGEGQKRIEMQFLSDIYITCEVCHGSRYNSETLEVLYHGKNIAQVLDMTVEEAKNFFSSYTHISEKIRALGDVGLDYIHLGQPAPTLSGGEAQRVKLASELSRRATGKTIYILDEPTTGLHFADLERLLHVLQRLVRAGNTVVVIEHNLDVIKNADWIIDLGPEGGDSGGSIVAVGTPTDIAKVSRSYTGQFLKKLIQ